MIQLRRVVFEKQEREKVYVYKLLEKKWLLKSDLFLASNVRNIL